MTCPLCDALRHNRSKPATELRNAVIQQGSLTIAPTPAGAATAEALIRSAKTVARLVDRSKPHAHATVILKTCPCGRKLEDALFECAAWGADVEEFFPNLRAFVGGAAFEGIVAFSPFYSGDKRYQMVVWNDITLDPQVGAEFAVEVDGKLSAWWRVPGPVAEGFWVSWHVRSFAERTFGGSR